MMVGARGAGALPSERASAVPWRPVCCVLCSVRCPARHCAAVPPCTKRMRMPWRAGKKTMLRALGRVQGSVAAPTRAVSGERT